MQIDELNPVLPYVLASENLSMMLRSASSIRSHTGFPENLPGIGQAVAERISQPGKFSASQTATAPIRTFLPRLRPFRRVKEPPATSLQASLPQADFSLLLDELVHDVRSPLQVISFCAELLSSERGAPANTAQLGERLRVAVAHIQGMLKAVVDAPKSTAPNLTTSSAKQPSSKIEARNLIRNAVTMMQPIADRAGVDLNVGPDVQACFVSADYELILRVLCNLVSNAIKFSPSGVPIEVGFRTSGSMIRFSVRDHGVGIAAQHIPHLFDRGWQANPSDQRGSGLGLAIVKKLVEIHGGTVGVSSVPGEGSEFFFSLPAAAQ